MCLQWLLKGVHCGDVLPGPTPLAILTRNALQLTRDGMRIGVVIPCHLHLTNCPSVHIASLILSYKAKRRGASVMRDVRPRKTRAKRDRLVCCVSLHCRTSTHHVVRSQHPLGGSVFFFHVRSLLARVFLGLTSRMTLAPRRFAL